MPTLVQASRTRECVLVRLADETAGHQRVAERSPDVVGGALHLLADPRELFARREGRVVLVGKAGGGKRRTALAAAADEQRRVRLLNRFWLRGRILEPVVRASEVDSLFAPQPVHDLELLGKHRDARRGFGERKAVRAVLTLHPACSEPELDAAARDVVDRCSGVRDERREAERRRRDERAEPKARRARREAGEDRPRVVRDRCVLVALRDVVVGAKERLDAAALAGLRERAPLLPGHVLLPLNHQCDPHGAGDSTDTSGASLRGDFSTTSSRRARAACFQPRQPVAKP
jgi:hypothetical protein